MTHNNSFRCAFASGASNATDLTGAKMNFIVSDKTTFNFIKDKLSTMPENYIIPPCPGKTFTDDKVWYNIVESSNFQIENQENTYESNDK